MEALQELGLNQLQMECINACRMYLQVTTLAEIVDHTGMTILPQILCNLQAQSPQGLDEISQLTLCWPCIHQCTHSSWQLWTSTICNLFTGTPNGTRLQYKLGEWTDDYQATRTWKWQLSPSGSLLYQAKPHSNVRAAICTCTLFMRLEFSITVPTNQAFQGPPMMPFDNTHCMVQLPMHSVWQEPLQQPQPTSYKSLTAQFRNTLDQWQRPLFGPIH